MNQRHIGYLIKSINDKLKFKADADLKSRRLTLSQSRVLTCLQSRDGQATQKEIEDFLAVSHPTVVGLVSRMEQNGMVTTYFDARDKRNKVVRLTKQALDIGRDMEQTIEMQEAEMLRSLSDEEIESLVQMLWVIYHNLEETSR